MARLNYLLAKLQDNFRKMDCRDDANILKHTCLRAAGKAYGDARPKRSAGTVGI